MSNYEHITTPDALADLCERLAGSPWLTVDTEFVRERTYYAELSLIQIGNDTIFACIDPLAISNLQPLAELLGNPGTIKIFHAADQDVEILSRALGVMPLPLFDSQAAATLLGLGNQIGYANLVQSLLGVELDKSQTRIDWNQRPLSDAALEYAADDVRYLAQIYPMLVDQLESRGRRSWLQPELDKLSDPARYNIQPEDAWAKLRGFHKLKPRAQNVARLLAGWRETQAKDRNRPRGHIVRDDLLLDLAIRQPSNKGALAKARGIPDGILRHHADTLLGLIADGQALPPPELPARPKALNSQQEVLAQIMLAIVQIRANAEEIAPNQLATRKEIDALIRGNRELPMLDGWRKAVVGDLLLQAAEGEMTLNVQNGEVSLA